MAILFCMIAVGFYARKKSIMNDAFDAKLSTLVLNIAMPCMIVASVLGSDSLPSNETIVQVIMWGALTYLFITILAVIMGRLLRTNARTRGTFEYLMVFSNVTVIGFPLLSVIFGPEAVVYGAIFNIPATLATWTIGVIMLSLDGNKQGVSIKERAKKLGVSLVSPCMIACIVSVFLVAGNVTDSGIAYKSLATIGQFTLPGAMFILGSSVAKLPFKDAVGNVRALVTSLFTLLVIPIATYFFFGLFISDPLLLGTITLLVAMPAASSGTMMCIDNDGDLKAMTQGTFLTTLLSMGTIPMVALMIV